MDWAMLAVGLMMGDKHAVKTIKALKKVKETRAAFNKDLASDPRAAMEKANTKLNEASRQEENRQNILEGI